jgi:hypothetical protein
MEAAMARWSLHLGLNKIDRKHYGTDGTLSGCVNDAKSMESIARVGGFKTTILLNENATADAVLAWLGDTAKSAKSGDTVFVSYAGHGSQVVDTNAPPEPDGRDETWCLYNRMVVDDELGQAWSRFAPGVKILFVSDSCHSGTLARALLLLSTSEVAATREIGDLPLIGRNFGDSDQIQAYRALPDSFPTVAEQQNRELYAAIQRGTPGTEDIAIAATVLSLTACQDEEVAGDGNGHGLFTQALLDVWSDGAFTGSYRGFFTAIKDKMRAPSQHPNYRIEGSPNASFESETPFRGINEVRKPQTEDSMSETPSIDERLEILMGNRRRALGDGIETCRCVLDVPRDAIIGRPEQEVFDFFQQNAAPTLMKAYLAATSVKLTTR